MPHNAPLDKSVRSALEAASTYPVVFYTEYLDLMRFPDDLHQQKLVDYLRVKYSDLRIDLILVVSPLALNFLVERGEELFPKTPIVFTSIGKATLERLSLKPNITGIAVKGDIRDTLDIVLRLQPDTVRVVIPAGSSALEKSWTAQTRESLQSLESRVAITYLTDLSMSEVLSRLSNLPPHTVVLFASLFFYDGDRRYFLPEQALDLICRSSNAPVYGTERTFLGSGIVGGHVYDIAEVGAAAGRVGQRILAGEKPGDIPIQVLDPNYDIFDARQLKRWGLSEGSLPPGSVVLYRQPTVWQSFGRYILGAGVLLFAQTLLIFGLLWQRARRRKVEAELFVINNRLRLALESGKAVGWEWDLKTGRDSWFGDLKTMFGIQSDTYVGRPEDFHRYVHPDDRQHVSEAVADARKNRLPYAAEFRVVWPDGTLRWVAATGKFYYSRNGEPVRMMGMAQDITQRKGAEQALRESEERLHLAVQAGRMYAFEWDAATDSIVRSGECLSIFNWMHDPTLDTGRQFATRVHPGDREGYAATEAGHTAESPVYQTSFRLLRPDGSVIWLEESGRAFFDDQGRLQRIIGMVADVTARKQAEGALLESDERFRLVANKAPVLIWMSGTDKLCTFFNKGWLDFTGRSMEQELGEGWASGVHADDLERCLGIYSAAFDARMDFEMEYRLRRFDGEYRWIVDYGVPRFESSGAFCGYIGSCVDITDRKLSEASLQELSGRLIHAQEEERTRIARELHDDLSQRLALLQIGLEQLAHDKGGLSFKARQQLHNIAEIATEASSNLHDLSHQLHPYKLDSLGLVVSLGGFCREFSEQHQVQVQFVHHEIPRQIPKEVTLCLFRITQEALRNVVKHSGASEARVELAGHGDEIDLCISDSGVGFDPESVKGEGGLGLISMRERLRLVRGHLVVASEPSRGTRIRVRVPLLANNTGVTDDEKAYKAGA